MFYKNLFQYLGKELPSAGNRSKIKGLTNSMDVEGYEEILKTNAKTQHKAS